MDSAEHYGSGNTKQINRLLERKRRDRKGWVCSSNQYHSPRKYPIDSFLIFVLRENSRTFEA